MDAVPKRLPIAVSTPADLDAVTQAFGSELRLHLISYFATNPGRQADAMRALSVERQVVHLNTAALEGIGVLARHSDRRYTVNRERVRELLEAVEKFVLPSPGD